MGFTVQQPSSSSTEKSMLSIINKYTTWLSMDNIDSVVTEASGYWSEMRAGVRTFDGMELKQRLDAVKLIYAELLEFGNDCNKTLLNLVESTKSEILREFPRIQEKEEGKDLYSKNNQYWYDLVLGYNTLNGLEEINQLLAMNKKKMVDAKTIRKNSNNFRRKIYDLKNYLKVAVEECERSIAYDETTRKKLREEEENLRSTTDKWRYLCGVIKEVLGDIVDHVELAILTNNSPCILRDSSLGGKTMVINPYDSLIEELLKRVKAYTSDLDFKSDINMLFQLAKWYGKIST